MTDTVELAECVHCCSITVSPTSDCCACGAELYPVSKVVRPGTRIMSVDLRAVEKQKPKERE